MPVCHVIDNDNFKLGLWELTEMDVALYDEFCMLASTNEISRANEFKNPSRKSEWIACRLLLYKLINKVVDVLYNDDGKPEIVGQGISISISHTKGMVAVVVAKERAGVDIELINDRVLRIEDRFLSDKEKGQISEENRLVAVLLHWSAKETLYKVNGQTGLDFKKQIYIKPFKLENEGDFGAEIVTHSNSFNFNLNYFIYNQVHHNRSYIVVYHYN